MQAESVLVQGIRGSFYVNMECQILVIIFSVCLRFLINFCGVEFPKFNGEFEVCVALLGTCEI